MVRQSPAPDHAFGNHLQRCQRVETQHPRLIQGRFERLELGCDKSRREEMRGPLPDARLGRLPVQIEPDLAQGALLAALRLGIPVPQHLAIAGFNDLTGSDQMLPPLTTVRTPRAQIGIAAAGMLLQLMRSESPPATFVDVGYEVVVRQST